MPFLHTFWKVIPPTFDNFDFWPNNGILEDVQKVRFEEWDPTQSVLGFPGLAHQQVLEASSKIPCFSFFWGFWPPHPPRDFSAWCSLYPKVLKLLGKMEKMEIVLVMNLLCSTQLPTASLIAPPPLSSFQHPPMLSLSLIKRAFGLMIWTWIIPRPEKYSQNETLPQAKGCKSKNLDYSLFRFWWREASLSCNGKNLPKCVQKLSPSWRSWKALHISLSYSTMWKKFFAKKFFADKERLTEAIYKCVCHDVNNVHFQQTRNFTTWQQQFVKNVRPSEKALRHWREGPNYLLGY